MDPVLLPVDQKLSAQAQQITALESQVASLESQLALSQSDADAWVWFSGLESAPVYPKDTKTPFQWIQAGNTGNTGGGSGAAHGTFTWTPSPGGTRVAIAPANIAPRSDDFFFYMVLPYPDAAPRRIRARVFNWACASATDWAACQQIEGPQVEYLGGGFQYTLCLSVTGRGKLQYWAGAQKWQAVPGAPTLALDKPTAITYDAAIDPTAHTYTYASLKLNNVALSPALTVPAIAIPATRREFSVAVQLDGKASAQPYAANLDQLSVGYSPTPAK